jgi:RNA binding exosome subunit
MSSMFIEVIEMQGSFANVMTAVDAQVSSGSRILNALETLRETTGQVKSSSVEIQKENDSIYSTVEDLKNISKDVQDSVNNVQEVCLKIAGSLSIAQKIANGQYLMPPDGV